MVIVHLASTEQYNYITYTTNLIRHDLDNRALALRPYIST